MYMDFLNTHNYYDKWISDTLLKLLKITYTLESTVDMVTLLKFKT